MFTTALEAAVVGQHVEHPDVGQQPLLPQEPVGQLKQEVVGQQLVVGAKQVVVGVKQHVTGRQQV